MQRAAGLRRLAALLGRGAQAQLEREAAVSWLGAAGSSACATQRAAAVLPHVQCRALAASTLPPDQLPLPDAHVRDDVEDAVHGEAEALAAEEEQQLAAALSGQHLVATDAVASLPLGRALRQEAQFGGRPWAFETGKMARLANGSCIVQAGGTTVLAAATCQAPPWSRRDAATLQFEVEYREKLYAVGRIPSTYNKREGAPKEHEVLAGRRIGRALRPLFPRGFAQDCAVFANVLSADGGTDADVMAVSAASAALMCSDMPWAGPVAAARVALLGDGELVVAPSVAQQEAARLNLLVACTAHRITMLEADGDQVPEADLLRALRAAVAEAQAMVAPQRELAAQTGRLTQPAQLAGADPAAVQKVADLAQAPLEAILRNPHLTKASRTAALQQAKDAILARLKATGAFRTEFARVPGSGCVSPFDLEATFSALLSATLRRLALEEGWRCDGRGSIDVRPVHVEIDGIPIVHGSALFTRGETQSLCTATVGRRGEQQRNESLLGGEGVKRFFVNYSFPPFAVDDVSAGGNRREMGHSELAERALLPVIPSLEDFPFSLRLNADTLASAGSSSMAAVCGGSLALWDAGVPLKGLVAGVAVGLLSESGWSGEARQLPAAPVEAVGAAAPPLGRYELLTDILGMEDQLGDMDLKVAGTRQGVTALQLDVKLPGGVPLEVVEEGMAAAARGRAKLLAAMEAALPKMRPATSPVSGSLQVPEGMVGRVIGPGGSTLRDLEEECDARVHIGDNGLVHLFAASQDGYARAEARILGLAGESVKEGEVYRGTVVRLMDYGALMLLAGSGAKALLHISEVSPDRIRDIGDVLQVGQELEVLCLGKDAKGQVKLSRKALLARQAAQAAAQRRLQGGGGWDADK